MGKFLGSVVLAPQGSFKIQTYCGLTYNSTKEGYTFASNYTSEFEF